MVKTKDMSREDRRQEEESELIVKIAEEIFPDKKVADMSSLGLIVVHDSDSGEHDTDGWRVQIWPLLRHIDVFYREDYDNAYKLAEKYEIAIETEFQLLTHYDNYENNEEIDKSGEDGWLT